MKRVISLLSVVAIITLVVFVTTSAVDLGRTPTTISAAEPVELPTTEELIVFFSETEAFHTSGITVTLTASNPDARIFYTLDGSFPTARSRAYRNPININQRGRMNAVTLRAIAIYGNETSATFTQSYFLGSGVHNRFSTMVVSLATTPSYLFDHNRGIFVPGALRENFIRSNPGVNPTPLHPANFNMRGRESERPASLEVFSPDGDYILSQDIGIRVHGGWSRGHDQKSIRLIPRRIYTPHTGSFRYNFFPGDTNVWGEEIVRYDQMILRNGGNDNSHALLRNELGSVLIRNAGFLAVTPVRPAAVFVNGRYYGFAWLQVRFNEQYLERLFDAPTREFDIVGMGERWIDSDDPRVIADINALNNFAYRNLRDNAIFAELEAILDIEDFLFYYAFQIFIGQEDWPQNNLRRWRYTGPISADNAPELDGRWRHIVFDLDWTFGLYGDDYTKPTFRNVIERNAERRWTDSTDPRSPLLNAILERDDMADRFVQIMRDISQNYVNERVVRQTLHYLMEETGARREMEYAIQAGTFESWFTTNRLAREHEDIIHFAANRHRQIDRDLQRRFGVGLSR